MIFSSLLLSFARVVKKMKKNPAAVPCQKSDPKMQLWTNGSVAYSVARELDQKEVRGICGS